MAHYDVIQGPSHQELMFALHDQGRSAWRRVRFTFAPFGANVSPREHWISKAADAEVYFDSFSWQSKAIRGSVVLLSGELNRDVRLNCDDSLQHTKGGRVTIMYDFKTRRGQVEIIEPKPEVPFGSETTYIIPVTYDPLPPIAQLEQEFSGKDSVSDIFDGSKPFEMHPSCANIDQVSGTREMLVKHFDREIESEEAIAEMDAKGYRPATHLEARDFAKAHPDLQREFWIVALGAFALDGSCRWVAVLSSNASRRLFDRRWFISSWNAERRFLFARK